MIAVIDYGIGNVRSVLNAFEFIGAQAVLTCDPVELERADGLVLPGVGAFGEGMRRLDTRGLRAPLTRLARAGKPLLGICLGFQMLMRSSTEQGQAEGLALLDHAVVRLPVEARLPHIGWSRVKAAADAPPPKLLAGLDNELFYFVHSYGVVKPKQSIIAGLAAYGGCEIAALIEADNVFGTQFHPEKSGEAGLQMLRNFRSLCL
ncbi:MAG: imidazole glycerol phosphate synthase subunit HisH [Rhodocyclaceae bacterium]|nr:imidazole glycerol phosphate synthase subunit HisH [Rhodocyclaceae bacterium]